MFDEVFRSYVGTHFVVLLSLYGLRIQLSENSVSGVFGLPFAFCPAGFLYVNENLCHLSSPLYYTLRLTHPSCGNLFSDRTCIFIWGA
jgi:hypothetical protein